MRYIILFIFCLSATSCGPIQLLKMENMASDERLFELSAKTNDELCHIYNNVYVKPETERQVADILRGRNIDKCEALLLTRIIPSGTTKSTVLTSDNETHIAPTPASGSGNYVYENNDTVTTQLKQLDVVGLIPGVSTEKDVKKIKSWSGDCHIGGMELVCVDNYIDGKLSALWVFTGEEWSRDEETNEKISNIKAFDILLKGFKEKFGEPQESREETMVNGFGREATNHYVMWTDQKGNRISIMLYDGSFDKGNLIVLSSKYVEKNMQEYIQKEKERKGKF